MASHTFTTQRFPVGATVEARLRTAWPAAGQPSGTPPGAAVASGVVGSNGSVTLTGLADDTAYVATALVSGEYRYIAFRTPPPQSEQVAAHGEIRTRRVTTGAVAATAVVTIAVTWATAFPDASYSVIAEVEEDTTAPEALEALRVLNRSATGCEVRVRNNDTLLASTGTLHVVAIHD